MGLSCGGSGVVGWYLHENAVHAVFVSQTTSHEPFSCSVVKDIWGVSCQGKQYCARLCTERKTELPLQTSH